MASEASLRRAPIRPRIVSAGANKNIGDADDVESQVKLIRTLILTDKADEALKTAEKLASAHPDSAP